MWLKKSTYQNAKFQLEEISIILLPLGLKYSFKGPVMKDFCICFEFAGGN